MDFLRPPWKHQLEAMRRQALLSRLDPQDAGYGLFFEPGAGKSATAINIWRDLCNSKKKFLRTLIFCPPIVVPNWKNEFTLNSKIDPSKVILLNGPGTRRFKLFTEADGPRIFVTNYESLLMKDLYDAMLAWQPEAIIFDESHKLKNPSAKRSKLAERLANQGPVIPYKQILSGSPVLKDPMDLFMQFLILDGGRTFGGNFFVFRARFFRDRNAGMPKHKYFPRWEAMTKEKDGFDALTEINLRIQSRAMAVKKSECMDLPPFIRQTIKVGMAPEQARLYQEMKKDFIAIIEDKACTATLAITKALRLQQIASGYIKTVDGEEIELEGCPKMDALESLLEELTPTSKVLVWAVWKNNYVQIKQVCEKLGLKCVEVTGEVSATQKQAAVKQFNEDPGVRVLLGNPGAGGIGINLVSAAYSIFYSRTFSLEHSIQAEARNYRGGSEVHEKITRYDLVCENTIDEIISEKLALKIEVGEALIRDLSVELIKQG
jgi:SNF2 family DNA or RNA helicase